MTDATRDLNAAQHIAQYYTNYIFCFLSNSLKVDLLKTGTETVIEVMIPSGHLPNINEIMHLKMYMAESLKKKSKKNFRSKIFVNYKYFGWS